ncbi:MAG: DUF3823 domain-containing protein, partial [Bacteroidota bacterium]|nr:DUF3823 domain-containing protein [Bacteroidota bacterium]
IKNSIKIISMKNSLFYLIIILFFASPFFACKKDNLTPPPSILSGHLLYQQDTIFVEAGQVPILVFQSGFGKVGPVGSVSQNSFGIQNTTPTFDETGGYSLALYNGDYKIIVPIGQGPFMWKQTTPGVPDSIAVSVKGNQTVDLQVTPYYMIKSPQIAASGTDSLVASCQVQKIITDSVNAKNIDFVALYVNNTQFVAGSNNVASSSVAGSAITDMNNIKLGVHVPTVVPSQSYMFARIGVKITNVEDLIFSPLFKVQM